MVKFSVEHLERNAKTGGVVSAIWAMSVDGKMVETGKHVFLEKDPAAKDFMPFESLTEQIVLEWLDADLDFAKIRDEFLSQKPQVQATSLATGLPWKTN
jgi:hypothetical protein